MPDKVTLDVARFVGAHALDVGCGSDGCNVLLLMIEILHDLV